MLKKTLALLALCGTLSAAAEAAPSPEVRTRYQVGRAVSFGGVGLGVVGLPVYIYGVVQGDQLLSLGGLAAWGAGAPVVSGGSLISGYAVKRIDRRHNVVPGWVGLTAGALITPLGYGAGAGQMVLNHRAWEAGPSAPLEEEEEDDFLDDYGALPTPSRPVVRISLAPYRVDGRNGLALVGRF